MNKKPPELHLIDGTKSRRIDAAMLPNDIKKRIPQAEWVDNHDAWNKSTFINETSEFLYSVYGIGNDQDKHALGMLADHIDLYVKCSKGIDKNGVVTTFNNGQTIGPNPYIGIRNKTMSLIIQLMNELGLTPRSRLASNKLENDSPMSKLMRGPKG